MAEIRINGAQPNPQQRSKWQTAFDQAHRQRDAQTASENKAYTARDRQVEATNRLVHAMAQLERRLSQPLRPSSFATGQRAIDALEYRVNAFHRRTGINAVPAGEFGRLRTGMADERTAHRVANVLKLGSLGQKAAEQRSYSELVKIERELKRIDNSTKEQLRFTKSPADRARVQRLENAMVQARSRISSGLEGTHPATVALGKMGGRAVNLFRDPFARTAIDIASATIGFPYAANSMYAGLIGMQRPFLDFSMAMKAMGRAGGFAGSDLMNRIYPQGIVTLPKPGMYRSAQAQALGLGPLDAARNLANYGASFTTGQEGYDIATSIRRQFISPGGFGLGEDVLAKVLGVGRELGAVQGGGAFTQSSNRYWNQFEKVMSSAVGSGVDRSRMAQVFVTLQQQSASRGALGTNPGGFGRFMDRMLASGSPGARNGSDILSAAGNIDKAVQGLGIGGNTPGNIAFASMFGKQGLPRTEDQLRRFLGVSKQEWATNWVRTPAQQRALADFLQSAKQNNPVFAATYMGQLLVGHQNTTERLLENSSMFKSLPANLQDLARSGVLTMPLNQSLELGSTQATAGNAPGANMRQRAALEAGRLQRDLKLTRAQASGLAGVLAGEGLITGNEYGKPAGTGGYGIAQWTGSRRKQFFAWAAANGLDPSSYETQQQYLTVELKSKYADVLANIRAAKTPEEAANATMPFEFGSGSTPASAQLYALHGDERRRMASGIYADISGNSPVPELNKLADQQTAQLKKAEYVGTLSDTVVATFTKIASAGEDVASAFAKAAAAAERFAGGGHGYGPVFNSNHVPGYSDRKVLK